MRSSKYNSKITFVDGIRFDSKREARRYSELKLAQKVGIIRDLELQPEYVYEVDYKKMFSYFADFRYQDVKSGQVITEDCKGFKTQVYKLKKKLIEAQHKRRIIET